MIEVEVGDERWRVCVTRSERDAVAATVMLCNKQVVNNFNCRIRKGIDYSVVVSIHIHLAQAKIVDQVALVDHLRLFAVAVVRCFFFSD